MGLEVRMRMPIHLVGGLVRLICEAFGVEGLRRPGSRGRT